MFVLRLEGRLPILGRIPILYFLVQVNLISKWSKSNAMYLMGIYIHSLNVDSFCWVVRDLGVVQLSLTVYIQLERPNTPLLVLTYPTAKHIEKRILWCYSRETVSDFGITARRGATTPPSQRTQQHSHLE